MLQTRISHGVAYSATSTHQTKDHDGGSPEHFAINVRAMERAGIAAVIFEDKAALKRNSLFKAPDFPAPEAVDRIVDIPMAHIKNTRQLISAAFEWSTLIR